MLPKVSNILYKGVIAGLFMAIVLSVGLVITITHDNPNIAVAGDGGATTNSEEPPPPPCYYYQYRYIDVSACGT